MTACILTVLSCVVNFAARGRSKSTTWCCREQQLCDPVASGVDVWLISEGYGTGLGHYKPSGIPQWGIETACFIIGHSSI